MGIVIGIDVGGSTTKIVGFRQEKGKKELMEPLFVRATDPITSIYGAFGKFVDVNALELSDIERVRMTGVGSSYVTKPIYSLHCDTVPEFRAIGLGGFIFRVFLARLLSVWERERRWSMPKRERSLSI